MELLIVAVVAFIMGWRIAQAWQTIAFRRILKDLGITDEQMRKLALANGIELEDSEPDTRPTAEHEIVIEQHGSELYAYKVDGEFLAQAPDQEALIQRIADRYKNARFTVKSGRELLQKSHN